MLAGMCRIVFYWKRIPSLEKGYSVLHIYDQTILHIAPLEADERIVDLIDRNNFTLTVMPCS